MSDIERDKDISRYLAYILRHHPETINASMDRLGWVSISDILEATEYTLEDLIRVSQTNDKQRFEISSDRTKIRAYQGHTVDIDNDYTLSTPPRILYHGTCKERYEAIMNTGYLLGMSRKWVHMTTDPLEAYTVGKRYGTPLIFKLDTSKCKSIQFYKSGNGVWLTEKVPVDYLDIVDEQPTSWRPE